MRTLTSAWLLLAAVGCGSTNGDLTGAPAPTTPVTTPSDDAGLGSPVDAGLPPPMETDAGATTPPNQQGCTEANKLVYVISEESKLYSFNPANLMFHEIGAVQCEATKLSDGGAAHPQSMAVDRQGTAWVNYTNGQLFQVDTTDAGCKLTTFKVGQHGFVEFGMAFASDPSSPQTESLYVVGIGYSDDHFVGKGLAKINTTTLALNPLGDFSAPLTAQAAELTGTGDNKLYGFFTTSPASYALIDETSAATTDDKKLTGVSVGDAWAFSFWGGDFWFYTAPSAVTSPGSTSSVTHLKTSDGSIEVVKSSIGFRIVGAGVSTCAPTSAAPDSGTD